MKHEMTIRMDAQGANSMMRTLTAILRLAAAPLLWLQEYYSACLNDDSEGNSRRTARKLSMRETLQLLHVQVAFLFAVFPVSCPLLLRALFIAWFAITLKNVKSI